MKINVNDTVIVNLTQAGLRQLTSWYTDLAAALPMYDKTTFISDAVFSHHQADGNFKFHLWDLMQIFGPLMYNGSNKLPFKDNAIELLT